MRYRLLYSDDKGTIFEEPVLDVAGETLCGLTEVEPADMIPLPVGADLAMMPGRSPVGLRRQGGRRLFRVYTHRDSGFSHRLPAAVSALLPVGYTRLLLPASLPLGGRRSWLPLYGYTLIAAGDEGELYVAAIQTDDPTPWSPGRVSPEELRHLIARKRHQFPQNRLVDHLARCALEYHCITAINLFLGRGEAALPVSRNCNAACVGCISLQPAGCCPAAQSRIAFRPTLEEIVEVAVSHLQADPANIISGGQGCEGEPLLEAVLWEEALRRIRERASSGVIHLNTNASSPKAVERLARAGLDSIRVSLISADPTTYECYHRPSGYRLADVWQSLDAAGKHGLQIALNLLAYPGLTDTEAEMTALWRLLSQYPIDCVQLRNLNIDPLMLRAVLPPRYMRRRPVGMRRFIEALRRDFPTLRVGSYTAPVDR